MRVRMKVLTSFSRNLGGQIIVGDPDHPDEEGRILHVKPEVAAVLERDKQAAPYSLKDQARDEIEAEDDDAGEGNGGVADVDAASTAGTGAEESAQQVRDRRTNTSGKGAAGAKVGGKGAQRRTNARRGQAAKPTDVGGAPVGGHDTNASTNHPATSVNTVGTADPTNEGVNAEPGADAAPTK
jgi:hypothetical protein